MVKIVPNPGEDDVPVGVVVKAIEDISKAMKVLSSSRLTRRALVALIHDNSRVPKGTIEIVLNNLDSLEETWLKKKPHS